MPNAGNYTIDDGLGAFQIVQVGDNEWKLLQPFVYVTNAGKTITVPSGFITDGASSPFRALIESWAGHYSTAALVHDWLYTNMNRGTPILPSRADDDAILYEIMKKCGVHLIVRWLMWLAVRGFGGPGMKGLGIR